MNKYYIKLPGESQLMGPSNIDEIRNQIESGRLGNDALVIVATGQSAFKLKQATDWVPVSTLFDVLPIAASTESIQEGAASTFPLLLVRRYSDAYTEAHTVVTIGKIIKSAAVLLFFGILLAGILIASESNGRGYSSSNGSNALFGFVLACLTGIPTYVLGILVAAQGQTALATLDTAVNSSRHLNDSEVAGILSKRFSL